MSYNNLSPRRCYRLSTPVRLGVAAVAACFLAAPVLSNPVNPTVVNGAATFNQVGNVLTVTNSNGAIINWDKFSIKTGETTHFAQTSASSSVLNRVLNDPTAIYGTLSSNGRVWLVNPAGIMVGAGGRVDVAGFVASTLNISNADFLAGRNLFVNDGTAKDVINQGEIRTPAGGSVYLIGSNVSNEGIITTPKGETILAAGATVSLIDSALPGVKVDITGAEGNSTNLGTITAEAGRIGIAGVIVRNSGTLNASSVVEEGGRIFLKASQDTYVDGNGRIVTTGTKGGTVEVLGDRVAVMDNASIDASGASGGGTIKVGGDYQGKNPDIQNASITYLGHNASLKADATEVGDGGTVIVWADDTTRAYGSISAKGGANGGNGGFVETSGKRRLNFLATVDTSAPKGKTGTLLLDPTDIEIVSGSALANGTLNGGTGVFDGDPNPLSTIGWDTIQTQLNSTDVVIQTSSSSITADFGGTIFVNGSPSGASIPITHSYYDESGVFRSYTNTSGPTYSSANKLSLLAENAVNVNAPFGNAGTGAITIVAGWDSVVSGGNPTPLTAPQTVAYTGATSHNINFNAVLATNGPLTLKATDTVNIDAASSWAGIEMTTGTLDITANKLALTAGNSGFSGTQYGARIATNGDQYFSLGASGGLFLQGSNQPGGYGGSANIERFLGTSGGQHFTMNVAGGEISVVSGSGNGVMPAGYWSGDCYNGGCSGNFASISDRGGAGGGGQTIDFVNGGIITVVGGQAGSGNFAEIHSNGPQKIWSSGGQAISISIFGGTGGVFNGTNYLTNDAGISSKVSQTINTYGGALTMVGGGDANTYGGAFLGAPVQNLSFGNVTLTGGASNAQDPDGFGSPVAIGEKNSANVTMNTWNLNITGGLGTASPVGIGSLNGAASVVVTATGDVTIDSGNGGVGIGSIGAAVAAGAAGGVYIANGTSIVADGYISVRARDNVAVNGALNSTCFECGGVSITAGDSPTAGYGINGGNIYLGPNSSITGETVDLVAHGAGSSNGDIVQDAGGTITITSGYSNSFRADGNLQLDGSVSLAYSGGGYLNAYGGYSGASGKTLRVANISSLYGGSYINLDSRTGDASIGSVYAPGGTVYIKAADAILRSASNLNGVNIVADSVTLTSVNGGSSGGIAISAFVEAASSITAEVSVGASYGGISIANFGAQPGTVSLTDNAFYPGAGLGGQPMSIAFRNSGNLALDGSTTFSTSNSGDIAITSGGNLDYTTAAISFPGDNNILLGADGNLTMSTGLATTGDLKLSAGSILDVNAVIDGYNIELGGTTININADVTAANNAALIAPLAGGTINLNAGVTASGTSATPSYINGIAYSGIAIIAHDVIADGPLAYLNTTTATGDISGLVSGNITLTNGASFQAGNDIDLILAGSTSALSMSNSSYFLADYMTLIPATVKLDFTSRTSGGVIIDGVETTKTVVGGSGFFVVDINTPAREGFGLEITHASNAVTDLCAVSPMLCKGSDDDLLKPPPPPTKPKDKKTSCEEGSFGCEEDHAKDEKKDEKPGQKQVAQCSM